MAPSDQPPHPQGFQPAVKPSQNAWEKKLSFGTVAAKDTAPLQAGQKPESSVSAAETVVEPRPSTGPVPSSSGKQMQQDGARPAPASATNQTVPVQMPPSVKGRDMSSTTEPATTKITFGSAYVGSPQRPSSVPVAAAGAQPTMSYASIALKNAPPQTTAE
jgi:hypothetical protein